MAPPSSESSVRWCCSASVSVGAMSAAWAPFSTARSMAPKATTVFPLPTSPISSRCIGRSPARSASISPMARTWSSVSSNGSDQRQRSITTPRGASGRARRPSRRAQLRGERLDCVPHARPRLPHELAELGGADALRGWVHGHEADGPHREPFAEGLVLAHPELSAPTELPVQDDAGALPQLARDPGLVEPDREHGSAVVEDARLDALAAAVAHRPYSHAAHGHRYGRLLARLQVGHRPHLAAVAGRVREMLDQVAPGGYKGLLQCLGPVERLLEQAGPRIGPDRRVVWQRLRGGEPAWPQAAGSVGRARIALYSAQSSHHQAGWPPSWYSTSTPSGALASTPARSSGGASPAMQVRSSAPSAIWASVDASVSAGSPQATSSPPA